jgi:2-dehydro-3-deoxygluconokinase
VAALSTEPQRLVAVGDVMLDATCAALPASGERVHADVTLRVGGAAANAAVAAVAAGARATVIGRIGSDAAGDIVLAELARRRVDTELARDTVLPTGVTVAYSGDGAPSVVASRGANAALDPGDIPPAIDADALFISGYALFQDGSAAAAEAAVRRFPRGWIGIDVASPRLALVARERLRRPASRTVVFATDEEAQALTGEGPEQAAGLLAAEGFVACVKLGAEGAVAASGTDLVRRRAAPVERRSPFGAGDAFAGAFLVALAAGAELGDALGRACAAGRDAG